MRPAPLVASVVLIGLGGAITVVSASVLTGARAEVFPVAAPTAAAQFPQPLVLPSAVASGIPTDTATGPGSTAGNASSPDPSAAVPVPPPTPAPSPQVSMQGSTVQLTMPSQAASVTGVPSGPVPASSPVVPSTAPGGVSMADVEQNVVDRINTERAARGLAPLRSDPVLTHYAQEWTGVMPVQGYQHSSEDRLRTIMSQHTLGVIGENIHAPERQCQAAAGCDDLMAQPTTGVLVVDWMHSQEHRDNLLDPRYDAIGVGVFCDATGRMWATAMFSGPRGAAPTNPNAGMPSGDLSDPSNGGYTCDGQQRDNNPNWQHPPQS